MIYWKALLDASWMILLFIGTALAPFVAIFLLFLAAQSRLRRAAFLDDFLGQRQQLTSSLQLASQDVMRAKDRHTALPAAQRGESPLSFELSLEGSSLKNRCIVRVTARAMRALPEEFDCVSFEPYIEGKQGDRDARARIWIELEGERVMHSPGVTALQHALFEKETFSAWCEALRALPEVRCERIEPATLERDMLMVFSAPISAQRAAREELESNPFARLSQQLRELARACAALRPRADEEIERWRGASDLVPDSAWPQALRHVVTRFNKDRSGLTSLLKWMLRHNRFDRRLVLYEHAPERLMSLLKPRQEVAFALGLAQHGYFGSPEAFADELASTLPGESLSRGELSTPHRAALVRVWLAKGDGRVDVGQAIAALTEREQRALRELLKEGSTLPGALSVSTDSSPQGKLTLKP